ncbi:MAG: PD40 domain-containing protein [Polyangiaceae bacterium]|nr:PD40 domain-containing protein [Polyangiaceae bacterium]
MRCIHWGLILLALSAVSACTPPSGRDRFESDVVPVLEGRCTSGVCHGVGPDAEKNGEIIEWQHFNVRIDALGRIADVDQAYAISKSRINTIEKPEFSSLLRKPLAMEAGGTFHAGGVIFRQREDPAYDAIKHWIEMEDEGGEGGRVEDLTETQQLFARNVLPRLAARQCSTLACHGPVAPFTAFDLPLIIDGEPVFSRESILHNYASARMHLFLGGDPLLSRLIRKAIPPEQGGIVHRGGNDIFFNQGKPGDLRKDDDVDAIASWAEAERAATLGEMPALHGIVFVRGPVGNSSPLDHDVFVPGSDLFILDAGSPPSAARNITALAHPEGPADVRDPAVGHDGNRIVFAMRKSVQSTHELYEIRRDGSGFRKLTESAPKHPGGGRESHVQPTYGPDGRIYFVSTRAGQLAEHHARLDTEIWAVDPETRALERLTHDPAPELTPSFFGVGKSYGTLAFTVVRATPEGDRSVVFRMPLDHNKVHHGDPELHVHHGLTATRDLILGMRAMPDGRFSTALVKFDSVWQAGTIAIFDRQIGPELSQSDAHSASVGGFRHAFVPLTFPFNPSGVTFSAARHPVPMPDGRLLVTLAKPPFDPLDPSTEPDFGLFLLTLTEDRTLGGPRITAVDVVADEPGISEYDAEPLVARPLEDDPSHEPAWDPTLSTGKLAYRHVETLEAIMRNVSPVGAKTLRNDLVAVRLIESIPTTPDDLAHGPISASMHGRSRILAELPLLGGSLYLEVPAATPFRVQTLDAHGLAIGTQHRRWIDVAPGQTFPGGVSPALYPTLCATCHGSLSGLPQDAGGPIPDTITQASMTLATHDALDPRRPRAPMPVGANPIVIDFRADVLPLIQRSCVKGCHQGPAAAGGLDLEAHATAKFDTAYEALVAPGVGSGNGRKYVDDIGSSARSSYLVERLLGRELDAPRNVDGACKGDPPLDENERLVLTRWIDLGAVYRGAPP